MKVENPERRYKGTTGEGVRKKRKKGSRKERLRKGDRKENAYNMFEWGEKRR